MPSPVVLPFRPRAFRPAPVADIETISDAEIVRLLGLDERPSAIEALDEKLVTVDRLIADAEEEQSIERMRAARLGSSCLLGQWAVENAAALQGVLEELRSERTAIERRGTFRVVP